MEYLLAYDASCGPCRRFKRAVSLLDSYGRFVYLPLEEADSEGLLDAVLPSLRYRSFHLVSPDGAVLSGSDALPAVVRQLPGGRLASWLMTQAPGGPGAVRFTYRAFSRLHDAGSCDVDLESRPRV